MSTADVPLSDVEIARSASRGAVASVTRAAAVMALQTGSSLAIARMIDPRSYGIFGLALTVIGFVRFAGDLGVTYRLEMAREISDEARGHALAIGLGVSIVGALVVALVWQLLPLVHSGPAGSPAVAPVLALTLLISAPVNAATVLLYRRLAFRTVANAGVCSAVSLFAIQFPLLLAGAGVWAMVAGYVGGAIVNALYLARAARSLPRPRIPERLGELLRNAIPYQAPMLAQAAVGLIVAALVAALLGARGVGLFSWATTLASPMLTMVFVVEAIAAPSLSRMLRDDGSRFDRASDAVVTTFGTLAAAAAASVIGLVPSIVHYVFGPRWLPAVGAVEMAIAGVIPTSLVAAWAAIANSQNQPRRRVRSSIAAGVCALVLTVPVTLAAGVTGAGLVAYVVAPIVEMVVLSGFAWRAQLTVGMRLARLSLPLAASSFLLERSVHSPATLALAAAAVGVSCVGLVLVLERPLVLTLWRTAR